MAREPTKRRAERRPPPLPPETRTIGQVVAETIRFYAGHFWASLTLGIGPAVITLAAYLVGLSPWLAAVCAGWILLATASLIGACMVVHRTRPPATVLVRAFTVGSLIALPLLVAMVWFAPLGLAVPAVVVERRGVRGGLARGWALARTDYVHALGSLLALFVVCFLTQILLSQLLHAASQQSTHLSAFLASLVVSPIVFLGTALLYSDQEARLRLKSASRNERSGNADLPDADDADRPGPADTPVAS